MNEKETLRRIREIMFSENNDEEKITLVYLALRDQSPETSSQERPLTTEECFAREEIIENFEEEAHVTPEKEKIDFGSSIDAMLFGDKGVDDSILPVLEKEEIESLEQPTPEFLKEQYKDSLGSENIEEVRKPFDVPEMTAEEFNETSKDVLVEDPEPTEEEIATATKEMIVEMKDYSILHQREFADLSKLQLSAELVVSTKDLTKINSLMNQNINLLDSIEKSSDQDEIGECAEMWAENSQEVFIIHRKYFRLGDKNAQKILVQGVFEAFNSFTADNKIDLMKQYSEFIGEKEDEGEVIQESGVPLPKSYATTGPGSVPLVGQDVSELNEIKGTTTPTMTEEEKEEHNNFVQRMEDLENMLTGDYELAPEEVPTFEKIEEIAREHGDLAAKEYVSSLSQEQREELARQRVAEMTAKKEAGHHLAEAEVKKESIAGEEFEE